MKPDYHGYIDKFCNKYGNIYRDYKIRNTSILFAEITKVCKRSIIRYATKSQ